MHGDERAERRLAALDLLADERLGDEVEAGAAVLGRDRRAEQPELGHALDDPHVELVVDVVLDGDRQHPLVHELADGLLDRIGQRPHECLSMSVPDDGLVSAFQRRRTTYPPSFTSFEYSATCCLSVPDSNRPTSG